MAGRKSEIVGGTVRGADICPEAEQEGWMDKQSSVAPTSVALDNWAPQSTFICELCMYWRNQRCRRHSPAGQEGWPATFPTDFCGDHKMSKQQMDRMAKR
jgi:hypothetical protein